MADDQQHAFRGIDQTLAPYLFDKRRGLPATDSRNVYMRDGTITTRPGLEIFTPGPDTPEVLVPLDPEVFPSPSIDGPIINDPSPNPSPSPSVSQSPSPGPSPSPGATCPTCVRIVGYVNGTTLVAGAGDNCTPATTVSTNTLFDGSLTKNAEEEGCVYTVGVRAFDTNKYMASGRVALETVDIEGVQVTQWRMTFMMRNDNGDDVVLWSGIATYTDAQSVLSEFTRTAGCSTEPTLTLENCADSCLPCLQIDGFDPSDFTLTGCDLMASIDPEWDGKLYPVSGVYPCQWGLDDNYALNGKKLTLVNVGTASDGMFGTIPTLVIFGRKSDDSGNAIIWQGQKPATSVFGNDTPYGVYNRVFGCSGTPATITLEECTSPSPIPCTPGDLRVVFSGMTNQCHLGRGFLAPDQHFNQEFCVPFISTVGDLTTWQLSLSGAPVQLYIYPDAPPYDCTTGGVATASTTDLTITRDTTDPTHVIWNLTLDGNYGGILGTLALFSFINEDTLAVDNEFGPVANLVLVDTSLVYGGTVTGEVAV